MYSNCCGAEPSYLNDGLCGMCLEHASFTEDKEDSDKVLTPEELKKLMDIYNYYNRK